MRSIGPADAPENETERQRAVDRSGALKLRGNRELQRIVDFAASKYDTLFGAISILSGNRELIVSRCGVPFWESRRAQSFCAVAIHRPGEPLIVHDAAQDRRFRELEIVVSEPHVRFYAGMPIVNRGGYALGALCVADPKPRLGDIETEPLMLFAREAERLICG